DPLATGPGIAPAGPQGAPLSGMPLKPLGAPGQVPLDDKPAEPTVTPDNPVGRQEPAVSLEWIAPPTAKVGQPGDYTLVVRNACNIPVQQVLVRVRIPNGLTIAATEPKAVSENNVLMWELGTLMAKQEKVMQMKLVADARGDVTPQAWVTFTG